MFVMNYNELRIPFTINYQGSKIVIPFDNQWHEIPDETNITPSGVRGYLRCAKTNPTPIAPSVIEIDLNNLIIYQERDRYEQVSDEEKLKRKKVIEEDIAETIKRRESSKLLKELDQKNHQRSQSEISIEEIKGPLIEESLEINSIEDMMSFKMPLATEMSLEDKKNHMKSLQPSQIISVSEISNENKSLSASDVVKETVIPKRPLEGKRIPKNVANRGIKSRITSKKNLSKASDCVEVLEKK